MTKIDLALQLWGIRTNTPRDVTLCEFVENLLQLYGENSFELKVKSGEYYSPATMSNLLRLLINGGALIRLKMGRDLGRGNTSGSTYVFNADFYECVTDKKALIKKVSEVIQ